MLCQPVFQLIFSLSAYEPVKIMAYECGRVSIRGLTVSRLCMYLTCLSMASLSSSVPSKAPPLPGPETSDIVLTRLCFVSFLSSSATADGEGAPEGFVDR